MAELGVGASPSQSSLLLLQPSKLGFRTYATPSRSIRLHQSSNDNNKNSRSSSYQIFVVSLGNQTPHLKPIVAACRAVSSESKISTIITNNIDFATEGIEIEPGTGGGDDGYKDFGGGGGGGGGGDSKNEGEGESADDSGSENKKKMALSMSQKLTLGYAALVGMGGVMGFMKSGSQKSLLAGGISASVLYYVYTQLPTNPVYASSLGLGVSSALLGVMASRFIKSKKVFPAGVVSLVSFVMAGGYIHGILRSMH